ncbi:MAG: DUF3168 domain-containing protein [Robiginitomaculum sp.]
MPNYNPASSLAAAVHNALSNDLAIQSQLGQIPRLYDYVPEDPIYPYLTYGALRIVDESGDDSPLTGHTMTLHIWSRYGGRAEVLDILNAVRRVVESGAVSPNDARLVGANVLYMDSFRTSDGRGLHGLIRVSFKTEPVDAALKEVA